MTDFHTIIDDSAREAARAACLCDVSIDPQWNQTKGDPSFESCVEYWGDSIEDWCSGCRSAVQITISKRPTRGNKSMTRPEPSNQTPGG